MEIKTLEEMEVLLTSNILEKLKRLGNEFNAKINESLRDKVFISTSNMLN